MQGKTKVIQCDRGVRMEYIKHVLSKWRNVPKRMINLSRNGRLLDGRVTIREAQLVSDDVLRAWPSSREDSCAAVMKFIEKRMHLDQDTWAQDKINVLLNTGFENENQRYAEAIAGLCLTGRSLHRINGNHFLDLISSARNGSQWAEKQVLKLIDIMMRRVSKVGAGTMQWIKGEKFFSSIACCTFSTLKRYIRYFLDRGLYQEDRLIPEWRQDVLPFQLINTKLRERARLLYAPFISDEEQKRTTSALERTLSGAIENNEKILEDSLQSILPKAFKMLRGTMERLLHFQSVGKKWKFAHGRIELILGAIKSLVIAARCEMGLLRCFLKGRNHALLLSICSHVSELCESHARSGLVPTSPSLHEATKAFQRSNNFFSLLEDKKSVMGTPNTENDLDCIRDIEKLEEEKMRAILSEDYESAARLRDERDKIVKALEKRGTGVIALMKVGMQTGCLLGNHVKETAAYIRKLLALGKKRSLSPLSPASGSSGSTSSFAPLPSSCTNNETLPAKALEVLVLHFLQETLGFQSQKAQNSWATSSLAPSSKYVSSKKGSLRSIADRCTQCSYSKLDMSRYFSLPPNVLDIFVGKLGLLMDLLHTRMISRTSVDPRSLEFKGFCKEENKDLLASSVIETMVAPWLLLLGAKLSGEIADVKQVSTKLHCPPRLIGPESFKRCTLRMAFRLMICKHSNVINVLAGTDVSILGPDRQLCFLWSPRYSHLLWTQTKVAYVLRELETLRDKQATRVAVTRLSLLDDSIQCLESVQGSVAVTFEGEEGTGEGVTKHWFAAVTRALCNPHNALWEMGERGLVPRAGSAVNQKHLKYFRFAGRLLALSMIHNIRIPFPLAPHVLKHLLDIKVTPDDLWDHDSELAKNLRKLIHSENVEDLGLVFEASVERIGDSNYRVFPLVPKGSETKVTNDNVLEYIKSYAKFKLTKQVQPQLNQIREGFHEILPQRVLSGLDPTTLDAMILSSEKLDIKQWEESTTYSGYTEQSCQVVWFWDYIRSISEHKQKAMLEFATSLTKPPYGGFKALTPRFKIVRGGDKTHLPTSQTCFCMLRLPRYELRTELFEKMDILLREAPQEFNLE